MYLYLVINGAAIVASLIPKGFDACTEQLYSTKGEDKLPKRAEVSLPGTVTLNISISDAQLTK